MFRILKLLQKIIRLRLNIQKRLDEKRLQLLWWLSLKKKGIFRCSGLRVLHQWSEQMVAMLRKAAERYKLMVCRVFGLLKI